MKKKTPSVGNRETPAKQRALVGRAAHAALEPTLEAALDPALNGANRGAGEPALEAALDRARHGAANGAALSLTGQAAIEQALRIKRKGELRVITNQPPANTTKQTDNL